MSDPDETANLAAKILQAYRERASAEDTEPPAGNGEEGQAGDPGEDPDCE